MWRILEFISVQIKPKSHVMLICLNQCKQQNRENRHRHHHQQHSKRNAYTRIHATSQIHSLAVMIVIAHGTQTKNVQLKILAVFLSLRLTLPISIHVFIAVGWFAVTHSCIIYFSISILYWFAVDWVTNIAIIHLYSGSLSFCCNNSNNNKNKRRVEKMARKTHTHTH